MVTYQPHPTARVAESKPATAMATYHDATMPQLPIALDPLLMRCHFQTLLFPNSELFTDLPADNMFAVTDCEIMRVKYRAAQKCVISYRVQIQHQQNGQRHEQWLCARVFPAGTAEDRYHKALREPLTAPAFGEPVMCLPELEMVVWAFPNDRKIAGLPALMASATRENHQLDEIAAACWPDTPTIVAHETRLIHYVPEHTCTMRVQLTLAAVEKTLTRTVTLFGKAYYDDEGVETFRLMQQLWYRSLSQQDRLRIAKPLAYEPTSRLLWQEGLPGRTLLTYALGSGHFDELLAEAARSVATLHSSALRCRRSSNPQEWLALVVLRKEQVAQRCPHLASAVETLAVALRCLAPVTGQEPQATLHGDLHLQNFLIDEEAPQGQRVALIDLDNLSTGSPWRDIGSFCAGLYYRGLVEGVSQATIQRLIDSFLESYADHAPWALNRRAIDWHTAAALLNERAFRAISRMKEGRTALIDDFIRIATELLLTGASHFWGHAAKAQ